MTDNIGGFPGFDALGGSSDRWAFHPSKVSKSGGRSTPGGISSIPPTLLAGQQDGGGQLAVPPRHDDGGISAAGGFFPPREAPGEGQTRGPRMHYSKTNAKCSNCHRLQADPRKRRRLCPKRDDCGRWVCRGRVEAVICVGIETRRGFNADEPSDRRCCVHFPELKRDNRCQCKECSRAPRKRHNGKLVDARTVREQEAPREIAIPVTVFILQSPSAEGLEASSTTVSVCTSKAQNRVVTHVDRLTSGSSCSRTGCQQLSLAASSQLRTEQNGGGVANPVSGVCEHGRAGLSALMDGSAQSATPVKFGGEGTTQELRQAATEAAERGFLSANDKAAVLGAANQAEASGVCPVMKIGETPFYATYDSRSQTRGLNWAHVKHDNPAEKKRRGAGKSKEGTGRRRLMCKACKGEPCQEYRSRKRTRCLHTVVVSLGLWCAEGKGNQGLL